MGDRFNWFVIVSDQMEHVRKVTRIGGPPKDVRVEYDTGTTKKELTVCVARAWVKFSSGVEQSYPACPDAVGSFEGNYGRQDEVGETGMFRRSWRRLQERREAAHAVVARRKDLRRGSPSTDVDVGTQEGDLPAQDSPSLLNDVPHSEGSPRFSSIDTSTRLDEPTSGNGTSPRHQMQDSPSLLSDMPHSRDSL